ncbi:MAG: FxsA family protein [Actinomycetota bacterium]|nr:FxsA family protein [Actinomycetota bacterium]
MEGMFFLLLILFLAVPLAEILVIVEVAQRTGILETIALLLIVSILGAWLVKSEGMGVIRKIQFQLVQGQIPNKELLDGGLILIAGVLMLTPGFITDVIGLLLLFPLTRPIIRRLFFRRIVNQPFSAPGSNTDQSAFNFNSGSFFHMRNSDIDIVDLRREDDDLRDPPSLEN